MSRIPDVTDNFRVGLLEPSGRVDWSRRKSDIAANEMPAHVGVALDQGKAILHCLGLWPSDLPEMARHSHYEGEHECAVCEIYV